MEEKLLKTEEIAELLRVTPETVNNYRKLKENPIPFFKLAGAVRFRRSAVERWLREREQGRGCLKA